MFSTDRKQFELQSAVISGSSIISSMAGKLTNNQLDVQNWKNITTVYVPRKLNPHGYLCDEHGWT